MSSSESVVDNFMTEYVATRLADSILKFALSQLEKV